MTDRCARLKPLSTAVSLGLPRFRGSSHAVQGNIRYLLSDAFQIL